MQSPLSALESCGNCVKYAGTSLCAVLAAFALLCAGAASEPESDVFNAHDSYPAVLDSQLRKIVESPAEEVQPLQEVCADILENLNTIVFHLERSPAEPCPELQHLQESVRVLETFRQSWTTTVSADDPYVPSAAVLDEISLALQRRIYVWQALLQAEIAEATPVTMLYEKSLNDVNRLKERTLAVEQYFIRSRRLADVQSGQTWCDYLETRSWITELEACQQPNGQSIRLVSLSAPAIPVGILETLSDRANTTIYRLESAALTPEQRIFLNHPVVNAWKEELQTWTADVVTPSHVLRFLERYESTGGMSDMKALSKFIDQLSASKSPEYRQLGDHIRQQYGMPNVRFFLSCALLNNHFPATISERAPFRDIIQSQPTVGRRRTDTKVDISFLPHETRVLTALNFEVDLATISMSDAFATQLFNTGRASIIARKTIELTEKGFVTEPSEARIVNYRMRLIKMDTNFDGVPLLSGLFRNAVLNQYDSKARDARTEAQRKMLRQVRYQIDRQTAARLRPINEKIRALSQYADEEFELHVEKRDSRTDENWLMSAWGIRSKGALSSNTPPPETLQGAFADLKFHESLLNMLLGKLELEGKQGTVGEFKSMLAEKFKQPDLAAPEENDQVEVMFDQYNPMVVRFADGRIEFTISIAALHLRGKTHRNFQVIVRYKPAYDSAGHLILERDGYISLIDVRDQFVMRTVFGKIFPVSRPLPLVPKVFEDEPQFNYLTTGHCRIENGWFALALVEKPETVE
ncbi:MAG: hypothetical protein LBI05_03855 [Planctomycetaceae bacterium]|jgi:hypothetical protein|nr:hypothetical protein [Planctomycetaceae bacterium]